MPERMTPAYEMVALLEARGCTNQEIADATGYNPNYIWRIKNEVEGYATLVADFKREIQDRMIEEHVDNMTRMNREVPSVIDHLKYLCFSARKEGTQLRAMQDWLDRASDAPKRIQRSENLDQRTIMIGFQQVENVRAALTDIGAEDVVELWEGEDYVALPDGDSEPTEATPVEV